MMESEASAPATCDPRASFIAYIDESGDAGLVFNADGNVHAPYFAHPLQLHAEDGGC